MEGRSGSARVPGPPRDQEPELSRRSAPSPAELRARRILVSGLVVSAALLVTVVVLLVVLSIDAYRAAQAAEAANPAAVVIELLRDASIVIVAFETLIIGILLIILMLLIQSLIVLFRDEIGPALEAASETLATVRGTTNFVSHKVVSPLVKWSGYAAGLRRILQSIGRLRNPKE